MKVSHPSLSFQCWVKVSGDASLQAMSGAGLAEIITNHFQGHSPSHWHSLQHGSPKTAKLLETEQSSVDPSFSKASRSACLSKQKLTEWGFHANNA